MYKNAVVEIGPLPISLEEIDRRVISYQTKRGFPICLSRNARLSLLRHEYTNYECVIRRIFAITNSAKGKNLLKERVNKQILEQIEELRNYVV